MTGPTARRRAAKRRRLTDDERAAKTIVRDRDQVCRFPLCGCKTADRGMKGWLTVSHDMHKGMGGDPTGARSTPATMILLCKWRHQDAPISRHSGMWRTRYLTEAKNDGPIAFELKVAGEWFEIASESDINRLAPLSAIQIGALAMLAKMEQ